MNPKKTFKAAAPPPPVGMAQKNYSIRVGKGQAGVVIIGLGLNISKQTACTFTSAGRFVLRPNVRP